MKPYSPKPRGSTSLLPTQGPNATRHKALRKRAERRDKKRARKAEPLPLDTYSSSAGHGGWGHDE